MAYKWINNPIMNIAPLPDHISFMKQIHLWLNTEIDITVLCVALFFSAEINVLTYQQTTTLELGSCPILINEAINLRN